MNLLKMTFSGVLMMILTSTAMAGNGDTGSAGVQTLSYKCEVTKKDSNGKSKVVASKQINLVKESEDDCGYSRIYGDHKATTWARQNITIDLGPSEHTIKMSLGTLKDSCLVDGPGIIAKVGDGIDFDKSDTSDFMSAYRDTTAMGMQEEINGSVLSFKGLAQGDLMELRCNQVRK